MQVHGIGAPVYDSVARSAREISRAGEPVLARVKRAEGGGAAGGVYEIKVTPPADRGVDPRVMTWLTSEEVVDATTDDNEPVDMTGYRVQIERVSAAGCNSGRFSIKSKPVKLAPNRAWVVESNSAIQMGVGAFPTAGDVDVATFLGPDLEVQCKGSFRSGQQLDFAQCFISACSNGGGANHMTGGVANITSSQATYVGIVELVYGQTP